MYIDVISTGSIRDQLYFRDLRDMRVPEVNSSEQTVVSEIVRRTDEELRRLEDDAASQKAAAVSRLHGLINASGALAADDDDIEATFAALANQWRAETAMLSSVAKKLSIRYIRRSSR